MSVAAARTALDALTTLDRELRLCLQPGDRPHTATSLLAAIAMSEETTATAMTAAPAASTEVDTLRARLITASLDAQSKARELMYRDRASLISAITRSVARIRGARSVDALIRQTCSELTGALAFRCATLSEVDPATGTLHRRYNHGDSAHTVSAPIRRPSAAELRCIAERRPIVVDGAIPPHADPVGIPAVGTNHVVAPVVVRSEVFALIHADRELPWSVDTGDVRLLEIVTAAFTAVHEREANAARLQLHQQAMAAAARHLITDTDSTTTTTEPLDIDGISTSRSFPHAPTPRTLPGSLTPRETEVLKLLVEGASNHDIADQLVISIETVKSHVKKVLRKLGAANRTEVVSLFLDREGYAP